MRVFKNTATPDDQPVLVETISGVQRVGVAVSANATSAHTDDGVVINTRIENCAGC